MIVVDSSALVAILLREMEADRFERIVRSDSAPIASPLAIFESVAAVARVSGDHPEGAMRRVADLLAALEIETVPLDAALAAGAVAAFARFGKGRHPAALNMGDCHAYALAVARGAPLLFKGDDFTKTDLRSADTPPPGTT